MRQQTRNNQKRTEGPKEEYAIVLDVVLDNQQSFKDDEIAQAIGTTGFTLLELVPKQGVIIKNGDKVYIGEGKREEVQYIKKTITPEQLSASAQSELKFVLMELIDGREEDFVNFFNRAGPITIRKHSLELIPGTGKKHLKDLLEERENGDFTSFANLKERCSFMGEPQKAIAERIIKELDGEEDFRLFTKK
jgi:putative nucleotide binding protein